MAFANPLKWPMGWPRNESPVWPTFKATAATTMSDLEKVLDALDAENPVITTNQPLRLDGGLRTAAGTSPDDTGVAVYFTRHGKEVCIPCDKFTTVYANLRAVGLTLEYIRRMERYGTSDMVDAAFRGFTALPESIITPPPARPHCEWYIVLGVDENANSHDVKAAYRELLKLHHPDVGGDPADMAEIKQAYEEWVRI
jgi:hypothetical protein